MFFGFLALKRKSIRSYVKEESVFVAKNIKLTSINDMYIYSMFLSWRGILIQVNISYVYIIVIENQHDDNWSLVQMQYYHYHYYVKQERERERESACVKETKRKQQTAIHDVRKRDGYN